MGRDMLKPREADIPALFLFFVVLPLVIYILLGKWSEVAKKKARVSVLAHKAAEEALRAEGMAAVAVVPLVSFSRNRVQECARCLAPATTRCSRCKSIKYWYNFPLPSGGMIITLFCCHIAVKEITI